VFSIPKRLRICFLFDSKVAHKIESLCMERIKSISDPSRTAYDDAKPGAAIAVQSFGDFQNFNTHLHVLAADGCFYNAAAFRVCPPPDTGALEKLFRHEVFKRLIT
jgi:hypothetical protein